MAQTFTPKAFILFPPPHSCPTHFFKGDVVFPHSSSTHFPKGDVVEGDCALLTILEHIEDGNLVKGIKVIKQLEPGPYFTELLSTTSLARNFFLDKNRIPNQISICCILLVTGMQLLFAYPENHLEISL